ncbi:phosphatase PAP2/dual specificity phosphatase family protein [Salinarimonas soli]|uniref:Phosphatase PAP2/dual specificity phosphatase family protein n=1 Tax=Salinarimonas soli TaxID=1638099 RepID=A0A5B2VID6_9HYPH|nr:phosphatase PAP2/dual specificity phosphatase family protein [Salinarimonas soli]KAA2238270.1 phosphatase PAP2/dual specificity phosphatase family protein [Salinarimonas soli]
MTALAAARPAGRPWRRAALWLAGLAPFFYATYGLANWLAAQRDEVGAVVFAFERHVPFLAWTIVPYWSINAFYAASLFVPATAGELDRHGRRLLTAQAAAVACFILWPLRFTFERPPVTGLPGFMFDALTSFDKPFNQAPSLHIALLVILWDLYARHLPPAWRPALHAWFALIGVSVLTTYQHHFVDVPTGALLGFACLWLWPLAGDTPRPGPLAADRRRRRLAAAYAAGAALLAAFGAGLGGVALWLAWPALSLALVALAYACVGAALFQKAPDGTVSLASRVLLAPYRLGAHLNALAWTRGEAAPVEVADGVHLGRLPWGRAKPRWRGATLVDLCAELPSPGGFAAVRAVPLLDLATPSPARLRAAAEAIERARGDGPVLVACALGYARSAVAVATWLLRTGRAGGVDEAVAMVRRARPRVVIGDNARLALARAAGVLP